MSTHPPGTAEWIAQEIARAFRPLEDKFSSGNIRVTLATLGLRLPESLETQAGFINALGDAIAEAAKIPDLIIKLTEAIDEEDSAKIISTVAEIGALTGTIISKIENVATSLQSISGSLGSVNSADVNVFAAELPGKLTDYLVIYHLESYYPILSNVFSILGFIEYEEVPGDPSDISKTSWLRRKLTLENIPTFMENPATYFESLYKWGRPDFDGVKLFENFYKLFVTLGLPVNYKEAKNPGEVTSLDYLFFSLQPRLDGAEKGIQLMLQPAFAGDFDLRLPIIQDNWFLNFKGATALEGNTGFFLLPSGKLEVIPPSGSASGRLGLYFLAVPPHGSDHFLILGESTASRITSGEISAGLFSTFSWVSSANKATGDFGIEASVKDCKIILDLSEGDGFINQILAGVKVESNFSLLIGISTNRGFYFSGSSALEIRLPAHIELGPVELQGLTFTVKLEEGKIPVSLGADIKAELGPLVAVVQNIGITTNFSFRSDNTGNLGPVNFDIGFKPPNGIGLSIDTGVIKGGGFLYLNFDKGEYFGALELSFQNVIDLKAIGIINTKMPDGSDGFSMLILVTAEFTPIQLGFGFTLNGVGGLLGLNRSTNIQALQAGVRTGAVSSILFPKDIVANIIRIISDLNSIFPVTQDRFIVAPMGKIGWGTPTLISLELGIIIEIPTPRIVILGVLKCILPTEEAAILKLQVNFAGGIDFEEGLIWFDASLFDSKILTFTLTGDMALRIGWGSSSIFVISVGGFHPAFNEVPDGLAAMTRLTISLLSGNNPRITVQVYFAITSNTVQSGARVELYAEAAGFNIYGYLGYDLLVQFSPFYFIAQIYAGLALRSGTSEIAGIHVSCQLSGPTPWNAQGSAALKILFFKVSVGFNETWGEKAPPQPLESADVLALVYEALKDSRNWKADLPANTNTNVSVKNIELPGSEIIVQPFTVLSVSQKVVPLDFDIQKFGNKKPKDATKFKLSYSGGSTEDVKEEFAPARFLELNDSEKITRKSFERMKSGVKFQTSNASTYGNKLIKEVNYEFSYVFRKKKTALKAGILKFFSAVFDVLVSGSAIHKNTYSVARKQATIKPAKVEVGTSRFAVVNVKDLSLHGENFMVESEAEAYMLHRDLIKENPSLKNKIQVVSHFELS